VCVSKKDFEQFEAMQYDGPVRDTSLTRELVVIETKIR
jgi:hypothetical protein